jgi:hypothetical protein
MLSTVKAQVIQNWSEVEEGRSRHAATKGQAVKEITKPRTVLRVVSINETRRDCFMGFL